MPAHNIIIKPIEDPEVAQRIIDVLSKPRKPSGYDKGKTIFVNKPEVFQEEVLEFIHRRFPHDSNWTSGNCYYFALILKDRFGGKMIYEPIDGHFLVQIGDVCFDYNGVHEVPESAEP